MTTTTLRSVRFRGRIRPPDDGGYGDPSDESEAGDGDAQAPRIARNEKWQLSLSRQRSERGVMQYDRKCQLHQAALPSPAMLSLSTPSWQQP